MPEQIENSTVHPGMSIGESIMQSVVYDVIDRKTVKNREEIEELRDRQIENETDDLMYETEAHWEANN